MPVLRIAVPLKIEMKMEYAYEQFSVVAKFPPLQGEG
jgi:hypothetical protein